MSRPNQIAVVASLAILSGAVFLWSVARAHAVQRQRLAAARIERARADTGNADAQFRLGSMFYYGEGVPRDHSQAVHWYRLAAGQGNAQGQYSLSYCYFRGRGISRDVPQAVYWLQQAAQQGYTPAEAHLGFLYRRGEGVPQDDSEAFRWTRRAAEKDDVASERYLGFAFTWGQGVARDDAEAVRWYGKAAAHGDTVAAMYLARAYRIGRGVPRSSMQALRWQSRVSAQIALRSARRLGWTPFLALLLFVLAIAVPNRRWRSAPWLPWTLMAAGGAMCLLHFGPPGSWTNSTRAVEGVLSLAVAIVSAIGAIECALHPSKYVANGG